MIEKDPSKLTNAELVHTHKYCRTRVKDLVKELKEVVTLSNQIRAEFEIRLTDLEIELEIAQDDRINSDHPYFEALLHIH
jgi:hypothetical protein